MFGNVIAFIVGLIVGLLIAWYLWGRRISGYASQVHSLRSSINEKERKLQDLQTRLEDQEATVGQLQAQLHPDDLAKVEGIGPKISSVLQAAGIYAFGQLAAAPVSRLEQILKDADLSALADPSTWPEQANLAAAGDWKALEVLQDELKGGRRA
jgi:predicted flap endonuclease-1-like 5' DNA nuclease